MRMLFVTSSLGGGGAERVMSLLINHYYDMGNDIKVVSLVSDRHEYKINSSIENIFVAKSSNKFVKLFERYLKLKKIVKEYKPDIIISFIAEINIYTLLCTKKDDNVIISERNNPNLDPNSKLIRFVRDKIYRKAKTIVFQTCDARNYFKYITDERCFIIPNPVIGDLPKWNPDSKEKFIFSAGRLTKQKNFPLLINAFYEFHKKHKDYNLVIAGEGEDKEELEKMIESLDIQKNVRLIGFTKDVHKYMSECQMFIQTSNYEGISNALLESLAIGVPTIATDCPIGGSKMIIKNNENGVLIQVNDIVALISAMNNIEENENFKMKISRNARKTRETYSVEKIIKDWDNVIEKRIKKEEKI